MPLRGPVLVERDLHAGNARHLPDMIYESGRGVAVARAVRPEQNDAVAVAPLDIGEIPNPLLIEPDHGIDPAAPIKIRPLVAHAQVHLDDAAGDGFEIDDPGKSIEMPSNPEATTAFNFRLVAAWTIQ